MSLDFLKGVAVLFKAIILLGKKAQHVMKQ